MTRMLWWMLIVVSAVAAELVFLLNIHSPMRLLLVCWFMLVCPGMAYVHLAAIPRGVAGWTFAVSLSLCIDAIVAGTLFYVHAWSPGWALFLVVLITLVGVGLGARRDRRLVT